MFLLKMRTAKPNSKKYQILPTYIGQIFKFVVSCFSTVFSLRWSLHVTFPHLCIRINLEVKRKLTLPFLSKNYYQLLICLSTQAEDIVEVWWRRITLGTNILSFFLLLATIAPSRRPINWIQCCSRCMITVILPWRAVFAHLLFRSGLVKHRESLGASTSLNSISGWRLSM